MYLSKKVPQLDVVIYTSESRQHTWLKATTTIQWSYKTRRAAASTDPSSVPWHFLVQGFTAGWCVLATQEASSTAPSRNNYVRVTESTVEGLLSHKSQLGLMSIGNLNGIELFGKHL